MTRSDDQHTPGVCLPDTTGGVETGEGPAAASGADRPGRAGWGSLGTALLIVALALFARLLFIGRYEVWLDEAYTFLVARKPLAAVISDTGMDNAPPLYYILLHYWMLAFGESAIAMRSLSAAFSGGTVALVVFWRTPWLSRGGALAAGFFLAITPLDIYYAQEARMYSAALFFATAGMVFLEKGLRRGRGANWAFFSLFTLLALYTSYIAIFLVPVGYLVILLTYSRTRDTRAAGRRLAGMFAAHLAAALLFLPWLPTFFKQPRAAAMQWIERMADRPAPVLLPLKSLSVMTIGGTYYPRYLRQLNLEPARVDEMRRQISDGHEKKLPARVLTRIPPLLPYLLTVLLAASLFVTAFLRGGGAFEHRAFLVLWLGLPILVPILLSFVRPLYVVGRYEIMGLPAFAVLYGLGLSGLVKRLRLPALILAALLSAYSLAYMQLFPSTGSAPERGEIIGEIARSGDVVLPLTFQYAPIYYYVGPERDRTGWVAYPRELAHHSGWIDYEKWLDGLPGFERAKPILYAEARAALEEAAEAAAPGGRIIIVRAYPALAGWDWTKAMEGAFADIVTAQPPKGIEPDMVHSRPGIGIVVYSKAPQGSPGAM